MTAMSPLAHALAFARRGLAVFPLNWPVVHRGRLICSCGSDLRGRPCGRDSAKHPYARLAPNGVHSATTDESRIREWFADVPDANLGVHADGLIVADVDPRDGGESWRALESEHGEVSPTWRVISGSKGEHIYFQCPSGVVVTNVAAKAMTNPPLGPGVDVRTTGGYLVAPPSRHISGGVYGWSVDHHPQDVALAPPPEWLIARLNGRKADDTDATPSEDWQQLTRPVLAYPDMAAASVAGHLLRRWVDPFLVAGLLHAWNQAYVAPPLPDDELRRILNRIARLERQRRDALEGDNHA